MKIGIDLDGVVVDIMTPILKYYNEKYDVSFTYSDLFSHDLWNVFSITREESTSRVLEIMDGLEFDEIEARDGAIETLRKLSENNELVVVTSRPVSFEEKTTKWIGKYLPGVFSGVFFTNQYSKDSKDKQTTKSAICRAEGVEILLEDHDFQVNDCSEVCKKIIVFDQPWNLGRALPENAVRVKNWDDVLRLVK